MKKSKMIYLFNIVLVIILVFYIKNYHYESKYSNEKEIIGTIIKIVKSGDNIRLTLDAKEKIIANCYKCEFNYDIGTIIKLKGYFKEITENSNFNLFNYKKYLMSLKIYKNFIFDEYEYINNSNNIIYTAYNKLNKKISSLKSNYFLKAMILGDQSNFDENIYENYKTNGIIHLFAISGMHVGIISSLLSLILKRFLKNYSYLIIYPVLLFYMLIINSASIIRSVLMFICTTLTKLLKIKISNINILFYLLSINLFINPYNIYNTGFLLSYIIVFFLILSNKKLENIKNYFLKMLMLSLISFLASLPIVINSNFEFNILTPFINVLIVPFVSIILFPLSLIILIFPCFDNVLMILLKGFDSLNVFFSSNALIINVAYISIYLEIIYYLILLSYLSNNKHIYLLLFYIAFLINLKYINFNTYLVMIDVGQGDSIFIKNYFGENILVDAGSKENSAKNIIIPYLKSIGVSKIDHFIISHGDSDHIIGAMDIIKSLNVKEVYLNSYKNNSFEEEIVNYRNVNLIKGNKYINEHIYLMNMFSKDENDDSLVTYLIDYKVLMMGDASSKVEEKINLENINILKVGHHGSKTSSSKNFVSKIKPKLSLISVGLKNKYNHPSKETLENLKESLILMTSINGMIKVNLKNLSYETRF